MIYLHNRFICCCPVIVSTFFESNQIKQATMGYKQNAEEQIDALQITGINRQPTDEDINKLVNKLTECAAAMSTMNGGGSLDTCGC